MNRILITLSLFLCVTFSSFSQEDGCCPDYTAEITVVDCSLEICLVSTKAKKRCPNAVFFVQIHNQDGDLVYSGVEEGFCFTFEGSEPGGTYTVSGTVSQDPTPIECFPPAQILPSTVTVPEDCDCCPDLDLTVELTDCNLLVCWEISNPDVEYCHDEEKETTIQLVTSENGVQTPNILPATDGCVTVVGAPGSIFVFQIRLTKESHCTGSITQESVIIPEDCDCCPDLTASVDYDGCDATICFNPVNPYEMFCEEGFNSILAVVKDENGVIVEVNSLVSSNCFTWTGGEPGQTYTVGGRIDYPYDCDGTGDVEPVTFTIPEDCGDTDCLAPWNIECHQGENDLGLTWEGPANAESYSIEIRSYVPGVSCCEPHENPLTVVISTTEPTIESMREAASFNCLVLRITTICEDGNSETTDWICFGSGFWNCPGDLTNESKSETRNDRMEIGTEITIYPNPGFDMLNLKGDLQIGYSINVFSITGEFISKEFVSKENQYSKDISTMNPGLYQVTVNAADGTLIQHLKFVKN
jgi:hypothetical protein